jgi:hypothetical protein
VLLAGPRARATAWAHSGDRNGLSKRASPAWAADQAARTSAGSSRAGKTSIFKATSIRLGLNERPEIDGILTRID